MERIIWLILRRMRAPLLVLIGVYSISILGMVLVPGLEIDGTIQYMDFFHAIYFVSYVSTTIGLGEIPLTFSDAQRFWAITVIYASVIAWIYSIGALLTLIQDPALKGAMTERRFARRVNRIRESFYLVCGYGESGQALVRTLTHYGIRVVIIDNDPDRINDLALQDQDYRVYVPGLCGDASNVDHLLEAGLRRRNCSRVVALTDEDGVNLKIAITSKLLNPSVKVICRAVNKDTEANMLSFGTELVINPFEAFGTRLALALHSPDQYLLDRWLTGISQDPFVKPMSPPRGTWIICGFGRFGKALNRRLRAEGISTAIIESNPDVARECTETVVVGRGTEAVTLNEAGIQDAVGIVAGTDDDVNNLSVIMTARELNPDLFVVARQNLESNGELFDTLNAELVMNPGRILARKVRCSLINPMLLEFLELVGEHDNNWAKKLYQRLSNVIGDSTVPDLWTVRISQREAPAAASAISKGIKLKISDLLRDPATHALSSSCFPLLLVRDKTRHLLPAKFRELEIGDRILFVGTERAYSRMKMSLVNEYMLNECLTGIEAPRNPVLRWMLKRRET